MSRCYTEHMSNNTVSESLQRVWVGWVLFGLIATLLGVAMLVWPGKSIVVASVFFGIYLVLSGVVMVVLAFATPISGGGSRFLSFISGAASVVLGVLAFRHFGEGYAILLLAIWIAIGFVFRGVWAAASATSHPGLPGRGWAIFFGVLSTIAGVVMLAYPFDSIVVLTWVAGSWLIVLGITELIGGFGMRRDVKNVEDFAHSLGTRGNPPVGAAS